MFLFPFCAAHIFSSNEYSIWWKIEWHKIYFARSLNKAFYFWRVNEITFDILHNRFFHIALQIILWQKRLTMLNVYTVFNIPMYTAQVFWNFEVSQGFRNVVKISIIDYLIDVKQTGRKCMVLTYIKSPQEAMRRLDKFKIPKKVQKWEYTYFNSIRRTLQKI